VFWVHASSASRFDHSVRDVLGLLRVHGRQSPNADLYELLRSWLIDTRGRRWLLILDNADEAEYLLESPAVTSQKPDRTPTPSGGRRLDYIPICDHGTVLITTRRRDMCWKMVHRSNMLEIPPMDADHALEMMQKKIGMQDQGDDIIRLAKALDFMPLAMAQAAAYIHKRAPRCSVQQYIEKLHRSQKSKLSLLNRDETDLRRDREASNSIISTWQIFFEHVHSVRPSAADLLSFMSFFDRQAIPQALLLASTNPDSDYVNQDGEDDDLGDNDLGDSQSDSGSRMDELDEDIMLLRDYSFISVTSDSAIFEMHALVQLATQKWLGGNSRYSEWRNKFIQVLDNQFPKIEPGSSNWSKAKALFPHAFGALKLDAAGAYAQPFLASLLHNAGYYAYKTGVYTNAERLWSTNLGICTQIFGNEHSHTLDGMFWLAMTYERQERLAKAEQLSLQGLNITRSLQERDHEEKATYRSKPPFMSNLFRIYWTQGRMEEAEQLILQTLELADNHRDTMFGLRNLALLYKDQGRWEEAEQLLLQAVGIGKEADGANAESTLDLMYWLGTHYSKQGRLQEAEQVLLQVQEGRQTMLGGDDSATLDTQGEIGVVYMKQGRLDDAELILSRVLESSSTMFGSDHPGTLGARRDLARLYEKQERQDEAIELYTQLVESQKSTVGLDHPDTLDSLLMISRLELQQGRSEVASSSARNVLEAMTRVMGISHPDTLYCMEHLAWVLHSLGRRRSALDLIGRCAVLSAEVLGIQHPYSAGRNAQAREWEAEDAQEEYGSSAESTRSGLVAPEEERETEASDEDDLQQGKAAEVKGTVEGALGALERSDSHVKV
jgi:tetratricopeptide (TPR) repeat protein